MILALHFAYVEYSYLFSYKLTSTVFLCRMLSASSSPTKNTKISATATSTSKAWSLNRTR